MTQLGELETPRPEYPGQRPEYPVVTILPLKEISSRDLKGKQRSRIDL